MSIGGSSLKTEMSGENFVGGFLGLIFGDGKLTIWFFSILVGTFDSELIDHL